MIKQFIYGFFYTFFSCMLFIVFKLFILPKHPIEEILDILSGSSFGFFETIRLSLMLFFITMYILFFVLSVFRAFIHIYFFCRYIVFNGRNVIAKSSIPGPQGEPGPMGPMGNRGLSAFEIWKDYSNKPDATEDDFFNDLAYRSKQV